MSRTLHNLQGCFVTNTEGIPTIYFAIVDEAIITSPTDSPANTRFQPRIRNAEQFSIKRRPMFWPWGDSDIDFAAVGELQIDNYDGAFDFLLSADLKDATVVFQLPPAGMLAASNTVANAPIVATCVLDDAYADEEDLITVTFKDTLARLDRPLLVRFNPPYADSSAANRMVPMTFGACCNVAPQLLDEENRLYRLHDTTIGNIAVVRDMGQPLDVNADPPQVVPALNRSGFQLQTLPAGKLLVDCSSVGQQVATPGTPDVLNQVGLLRSTTNPGPDGPGVTTWGGIATPSTTPPSGWSYTSTFRATFSRLTYANGYAQDWAMSIQTQDRYNTTGEKGGSAFVTTPFLQPGQHYRIRFIVDNVYRPNGINIGGFMVRTDLSFGDMGAVSGSAFGPYLGAPPFGGQNYIFDYACPADGVVRTLYVIMVGGGASLPAFQGTWHGLSVELLGQFIELPLEGITFADYFYEVLRNRAYEPTTTWNANDLLAIDSATGYTFGIHFDEPPNVLRDMLIPPMRTVCATLFTDALGVVRARRLIDPKLADPVAAFDMTNTDRPISISTDRAQYLTTLFGARRNWSVSGPSDFVSDYDDVPADVRVRYSRTSQYELTSSNTPAAEYAHAIGAPIFDTLLHDPDDAQTEVDRVVAIYSPTVYSDGTISSGKRRFVEFTIRFDEIESAGVGTPVAAQDILIGDVISLTYPDHGFDSTPVFVAGTELFPFAQKLTIWGFV
jgi:hypothetical protein